MATYGQMMVGGAGNLSATVTPVALAVTATTNTDIVFTLPAGARNVKFTTKTNTAFTAATDAQISIGNAAGGAQYVALVSIKAVGQVIHSLVGANMADLDTVPGASGANTSFFVRIVQTGSTTTVGAATLFVEYALNPV
jgi:hypothetical protein